MQLLRGGIHLGENRPRASCPQGNRPRASCPRGNRPGASCARLALLLWCLAGRLPGSSPAVAALDRDAVFHTTCWECRKGRFAKCRFSVRQCRSPRGSCGKAQAHTACDWTADERELRGTASDVEERGQVFLRRWAERFAELKRFKTENGHCTVPQSGRADGARGECWRGLARWVNKQQRMQRVQRLAPERAAKLEQLGFAFDNNTFVASWEHHYVELLQFKQRWGHCNVPTGCPSAGVSASFAAWIDWQRRSYKTDSTSLRQERRARLDAVGFVWDMQQSWWNDTLAALVTHCMVNEQLLSSNAARQPGQNADALKLPSRLQAWLYDQRTSLARGALALHRVHMLDESGVGWRAPNQTETYSHKMNVLASYKEEHGHCFVPMSYSLSTPEGKHVRLGEWCAEQRKMHRRALLKPSRWCQLSELGFPWYGFAKNKALSLYPEGHSLNRAAAAGSEIQMPEPQKQSLQLFLVPPRQTKKTNDECSSKNVRYTSRHWCQLCHMGFRTAAARGAHSANSGYHKQRLLAGQSSHIPPHPNTKGRRKSGPRRQGRPLLVNSDGPGFAHSTLDALGAHTLRQQIDAEVTADDSPFAAYPFCAAGWRAAATSNSFSDVHKHKRELLEGGSPLSLTPGDAGSWRWKRNLMEKGVSPNVIDKGAIKCGVGIPLWVATNWLDDTIDLDNCGLESFAVPPSA